MDTATETHAAISSPVPYGMGYIRTSLSGRNKHNGHSAGDCLAVQLDHDRMSFIL
jgi:hypothetical protein